jgi:hemerythrin-like domain-containing protein
LPEVPESQKKISWEKIIRLTDSSTRRSFVLRSTAVSAGFVIPSLATTVVAAEEKGAEEISPAEDLMREHGVLNRILLIYEEYLRRLDAKQDFDPGILASSAGIVRRFVEDYHEKLEEDFLFPRFRKANKLVDLVEVLLAQHQAGRRVTAHVEQLANASSLRDESKRHQLGENLRAFVRMYRPHEAREDTVLFPAFRSLLSKHEYDALGDDFEKKEDELFGDDGFFKVVDQVAELEKKTGIYELDRFTPK